MRLLALDVRDFRNIESADLEPAERATLIVGPNGQGKTNLLEAVYLLATLRPLRAQRYSELVRFGQSRARVSGRFALGGAERVIGVVADEKGREAFVDGKPVRGLAEYFGGVSVVAFTPDDLAVVKGSPDGRRRLLDRAVFNRFPSHLEACRDYQRALKQRNRLLKEGAAFELLDAYNEALARAGAKVALRRQAFVEELAPQVARSFEAIAPGDGGLRLRLDSEVFDLGARPEGGDGEAAAAVATESAAKEQAQPPAQAAGAAADAEQSTAAALLEALRRRTARDVERGFTSVGPHTDDLELELGGRPARTFASQGQQRAIVLAFKIAEIENLRETIGRPPLLLLDDVSSELDPARNAFLMHYLRASGLQVFLTTTDERLVREAAGPDARLFTIRAGVLSPG